MACNLIFCYHPHTGRKKAPLNRARLQPVIDSNTCRPTYTELMTGTGAHIRIKLGTEQPIALSDFVGSFVGIGSQFEKFVAREYPNLKIDSEFFVQEVRAGCVEADLIAWAGAALSTLPGLGAIDLIDRAQVLTTFVNGLALRIGRYFQPGGRDPSATKADLGDFHKAVAVVARDPIASGRIESAVFESDGRHVRSSFKFNADEARRALIEIGDHRRELDAKSGNDHGRVLLRFVRPSVEPSKPGRKGGERAIIEAIQKRALPVLYASDLAQERMHHEKIQLEGNIFRALFDVEVNVERDANERPLAYRITHVHLVIDEPDDD